MSSPIIDTAVLGSRRHYAVIVAWAQESSRPGDDFFIEKFGAVHVDCARRWPVQGSQVVSTPDGLVVYTVCFSVEPLEQGITAGKVREIFQSDQAQAPGVIVFDGELVEIPENISDVIDKAQKPIPFVDTAPRWRAIAAIFGALVVVAFAAIVWIQYEQGKRA